MSIIVGISECDDRDIVRDTDRPSIQHIHTYNHGRQGKAVEHPNRTGNRSVDMPVTSMVTSETADSSRERDSVS